MTRDAGVFFMTLVVGWTSLTVQAHHAISDIYDEERTVLIEGEVVSFLFGEPHSMVQLRVLGDSGSHTWAAEWLGSRTLRSLGWTAGALVLGERVKMCGHPGRDPGAYRLYLLGVARASRATRGATTVPPDLCRPRHPQDTLAASPARR